MLALQYRRNELTACQGRVNSGNQVSGQVALNYVSERSRGKTGTNKLSEVMDGEKNHFGLRIAHSQLLGRFNPVDQRHRNVGHDDIGMQAVRLGEQVPAIRDRSHHVELRLQQGAYTLANGGVIVSQQNTYAIQTFSLPGKRSRCSAGGDDATVRTAFSGWSSAVGNTATRRSPSPGFSRSGGGAAVSQDRFVALAGNQPVLEGK